MRTRTILEGLGQLQRRHPLALFLAFGACLFAADAVQRERALAAPAVDEASASQWLEDEVLYREARARGLDDGDAIVRRRLVQKMRLLLETEVEVAEPDAATLAAYIGANAGRYGSVQRMSLDHVFLSRSLRAGRLGADAQALHAALEDESADAVRGDPHPAGGSLEGATARDLQRLFGPMADTLATLPVGDWRGPLASPLGLHFVRVRSRDSAAPDLVAVRDQALRDYLLEQRRAGTERALAALKADYGLAATP